ncbi:MAG: hypothetical protein N2255_06685 [Kiritimatiellae bacterium]|nr:hypothetical protein [Kiritimatiellia bacterium]
MTRRRAGKAKGDKLVIISGVVPRLSLSAELGPPRSECGVGALMPWAGRLWAMSYVSSKAVSGVGTGLYEIDEDLRIRKRPESYIGTYTNRMVHWSSNQLIFGPYVIDAKRRVKTIKPLLDVRLCGTMKHLEDPENKVYMLGMEGEFFEMDDHTLAVTPLADLVKELGLSGSKRPHFKAGYCEYGRVVVASNTYDENEYLGKSSDGRLAEWDGKKWTILERNPFYEVTGRGRFCGTIFATGFDNASALFMVFTAADGQWRRYRLPKASHTFDHWWSTEWPRIRETEHERFLMDCHGMFYELAPWAYSNRVWGIRPICTHLWVLGDFCTYRGMLVLGADNASPANGHNPLVGEPQSGLWFGKTDDLWRFGGKPAGWGGVWHHTPVRAGEPSDPYLMTGFDKKVLHLVHRADSPVSFTVEVDFLGDGDWHAYQTFTVPSQGYLHYEFPDGFSAHWVRVVGDTDCVATAYFVYT